MREFAEADGGSEGWSSGAGSGCDVLVKRILWFRGYASVLGEEEAVEVAPHGTDIFPAIEIAIETLGAAEPGNVVGYKTYAFNKKREL